MKKYFFDTEFHEYHKQQKICGIRVGKPIPTIDIISIGIVADDIDSFSKRIGKTNKTFKDREYYAISKDFNIKDAWNSWQPKKHNLPMGIVKEYWLRDNVLKPIFIELVEKDKQYYKNMFKKVNTWTKNANPKNHIFNFKNFKKLINKYGKTNKQIAEEIHAFIYKDYLKDTNLSYFKAFTYSNPKYDPEFYAYYADYDWVAFAQLFGKMMNLPSGFPMYCKDLKQDLDNTVSKLTAQDLTKLLSHKNKIYGYTNDIDNNLNAKLKEIKKHPKYPKQDNEHNALSDAIWNKKLYHFINLIKNK